MTFDQWLALHSEQTILVPKGTKIGARCVNAKGEPCRSSYEEGARWVDDILQVDTYLQVEVSGVGLWDLAKRALRNKSRQAHQGPFTIKRVRGR